MKAVDFLITKRKLVFILLAAVVLLLYFNTLNYPFIWDDEYLIVNNAFIKNPHYLKYIFTSSLFKFYSSRSINIYRPIQTITYLFDYHFWKLDPLGYRLMNILIHILNSFLVYVLIGVIFRDEALSFLTSLFFAICPLHISAVTYISGRADLLVTFFFICSLLLFIKFIQNNGNFYYLGSIICFLLALFSKESALIFPLILVSTHKAFQKANDIAYSKKSVLNYFPFFIFSLTYVLLRLTVLNFEKEPMPVLQANVYLKIITFSKVLFSYTKLIFLPINLHMQRTIKIPESILSPYAIIYLIFVIFIFLAIIKTYKQIRNNVIFWSLSWFLITLIPVYFAMQFYRNLSVPEDAVMMAEHWLYTPLVGFFALIVFLILKLIRIKSLNSKKIILRIVILPIFISLMFFYAYQTIKSNLIWQDKRLFFNEILKYEPHNVLFRQWLAVAYFEKGNIDEALKIYKSLLNTHSKRLEGEIHSNIGLIYLSQKSFKNAKSELAKAIDMDPLGALSYHALGVVYANEKRYPKAIANIEKSLEINTYDAEAWNNLGMVYFKAGDKDKAALMWRKALEIDPDFKRSKINLQRIIDLKNKKH